MAVKPVPDGFHTVTPYLVCAGVAGVIDFLKSGLGAVEIERTTDETGRVMHAQLRIGDSMIMMGETMPGFPPLTAALYLYVPDTDALYERAMAAGGVSLMKPADQFYGDRNAGVQDPSGNKWYIATHIEDVAPEEIARRAKQRG